MPPEGPPAAAARRAGTVVLGLGNPILGDDAVGLQVAAALERLLIEDPVAGVQVVTSTRAGFEVIDLLAGAARAIIVDCLEVPDPQPGRIRRLDLEHVSGASRLVGPHDISVSVAFELAGTLGVEMPHEVEIYGIEAAATRGFGETLSPAVQAAVATLSRDLHAQLKQRGSAARPGPAP
jgi:hydrogenase maturation protease